MSQPPHQQPPPAGQGYRPLPNEQQYYEQLFRLADVQNRSFVAGSEAVTFLSRSGLPVAALKSIWVSADTTKTNALGRDQFYLALRLIALVQSYSVQPGDPHAFRQYQGREIPLPNFEVTLPEPSPMQGIPSPTAVAPTSPDSPRQNNLSSSTHSVPSANTGMVTTGMVTTGMVTTGMVTTGMVPNLPTTQNSQNTTLASLDPYNMTPTEQVRFDGLFAKFDKGDGCVHANDAVELFTKSGLDRNSLKEIWRLVGPSNNRLTKMEFAISMHLIVCISKKNLAMPSQLPPSLLGIKNGTNLLQKKTTTPTPTLNAGNSIPSPQSHAPNLHPYQGGPQGVPPGGSNPAVGTMNPAATSVGSSNGLPPLPPSHPSTAAPGAPRLRTTSPTYTANSGKLSIDDAFSDMAIQQMSVVMRSASAASDSFSDTGGIPAVVSSPPRPATADKPRSGFGAFVARPGFDSFAASSDLSASQNTPSDLPAKPAAQPPPLYLAPESEGAEVAEPLGEPGRDLGEEVAALKKIIQQMQAEKISLTARLKFVGGEEDGARAELATVVAEVASLSTELAGLRTQVNQSLQNFAEISAEMKALTEEKKRLVENMEQLRTTLTSLAESQQAMAAVRHKLHQDHQAKTEREKNDFFADALFGGGVPNPAPAPLPVPAPAPLSAAPPPSAGAPASNGYDGPWDAPAPSQPAPPSLLAGAPNPAVGAMNPAVGAINPAVGAPNPSVGAMNPAVGAMNPAVSEALVAPAAPAAHPHYPVPGAATSPVVEERRKEALQSQERAHLAEEEQRRAAQLAEERRISAELAQQEYLEASNSKSTKKKVFGKKNSKNQRAIEAAKQRADVERALALEARATATAAQAEAMKAFREAEEKRRAQEQAEIEAATEASFATMAHEQRGAEERSVLSHAPMTAQGPPHLNGGGPPPPGTASAGDGLGRGESFGSSPDWGAVNGGNEGGMPKPVAPQQVDPWGDGNYVMGAATQPSATSKFAFDFL